MTLKQKIADLIKKRGLNPDVLALNRPVLQDDADGRPAFIATWNEEALGPRPSESDGFSSEEVRKFAKSVN